MVFSIAKSMIELSLVLDEFSHDIGRVSIVTIKAFGDNVRGTGQD
jgi:hypothetical protein